MEPEVMSNRDIVRGNYNQIIPALLNPKRIGPLKELKEALLLIQKKN